MDQVLQAIADPTRRTILDLLTISPMSAGEIAEHFPEISRPAVSQHLAVLRDAELLVARRAGRHNIYSLNPSPLQAFWENWLSRYEVLWAGRLATLKRVVEQEAVPKDEHHGRDEG